MSEIRPLQQYLPFTVLKLRIFLDSDDFRFRVATVLTVYGIETHFTILIIFYTSARVATVLTVYGIETWTLPFLHHF